MLKNVARLAVAAGATAMLGTALAASPAAASPNEAYHVCYKNSDCNMGFSEGTISWDGGASPVIVGSVTNRLGSSYSTQVRFNGYSGSTFVDSDTRTVKEGHKNFDTVILAGNMNRIDITVCQLWADGSLPSCGSPETYRLG